LALIRGVMLNETSGEVISTSEHHLVNNDKATAKL
jgi:hypothetical protein